MGCLRAAGLDHTGDDPVVRKESGHHPSAWGSWQVEVGHRPHAPRVSWGACLLLTFYLPWEGGDFHRFFLCPEVWEGECGMPHTTACGLEMTKHTNSQIPPLLLEAGQRTEGVVAPLSRGFPGEPRFYRLTSTLQCVQSTFTAQPISAITGGVVVLLAAED